MGHVVFQDTAPDPKTSDLDSCQSSVEGWNWSIREANGGGQILTPVVYSK